VEDQGHHVKIIALEESFWYEKLALIFHPG